MATMAATVAAIRRLIKDEPVKLHLNGAISGTTEETVVVDSTDIGKVNVGVRLEHDDGDATGAEQRRVLSIDEASFAFEAERGYNGSTAVTPHADNSYMLIAPRFPYDQTVAAVNEVINADLLTEGLYDIIEREVTSSATTDAYNLPAATVLEILSVYQKPTGYDEPVFMRDFSTYPINVDTDTYAGGAYIMIRDGVGIAGSDIYYVNCKELLTLGTLTTRQELIVQHYACAKLIEWETGHRLAGPTNQGDRTVRTNEFLTVGGYWRQLAKRWVQAELSDLRAKVPPKRVWMARG